MQISMSKEEKLALYEKLFRFLNDKLNSIGFERVGRSQYLYRREISDGYQFIRLKRINKFSDWICLRVVFGYNSKQILAIFDKLNSSHSFSLSKPLYQRWIGGLMEGFSKEKHRVLRGKYSCFPLGEWEFRHSSDLSKREKIFQAIEDYKDEFFNQSFDADFFSNQPIGQRNECDISFLKIQMISARIANDKTRFEKLKNYYSKRKEFEEKWLVEINNYLPFS